jgi:hypothetical protein
MWCGRHSVVPPKVPAARFFVGGTGHHIYDNTPNLTPQVEAVQGSKPANLGAEDVHFEYQLAAGANC